MIFIILVNWNGWRHTVKCLESLKKLSHTNFQVVVVDNGSTDESLEMLQPFTEWIVLIKAEKNLGFGAGNNIGIRYALEQKAEYIWLLNNDTTVLNNTLTELKDFMDKNQNVGLAGAVIYNMANQNKLQAFGGYKLNIPRCYVIPCKMKEKPDYISGASMFIRKQAILDAEPFDEKFFMYWEDVDLNLRIKEKGWQIGVASSSIVYHKEGSSSSSLIKEYYSVISGLYFSWKHSNCFIYTLIVGFLFDRILKRIFLLLINPFSNKNVRGS